MPRKEPTRRKEKAAANKQRIYEAALAVIGEKGFEQTTIHDITTRAGVAIGTFYHHFRSKDGILEENFRRADEAFAAFAQELAEAPGTAEERILRYLDRYALLIEETGFDLVSKIYTYKNKLFVRRGRAMQEGLVKILRDAQEQGELKRDLSPEELCEYLFVAARGVVFHWCLIDGGADIRALMQRHFSLLLPAFVA